MLAMVFGTGNKHVPREKERTVHYLQVRVVLMMIVVMRIVLKHSHQIVLVGVCLKDVELHVVIMIMVVLVYVVIVQLVIVMTVVLGVRQAIVLGHRTGLAVL